MQGVPTDLFEAAKIDGAGYLNQFFAIMLPLVKPALSAQIVFAFVGTWNDYFIPSIYLNKTEVKTLQLQLLSLQQQQNNLMEMCIRDSPKTFSLPTKAGWKRISAKSRSL